MGRFKKLMYSCSCLFVLGGIALIAVGAAIEAQVNEIADFLDDESSTLAIVLASIGIIVFFVAFLGICGAVTKSRCVLIMFAILSVVALIAVVVIAVLAFIYRSDTKNALLNVLKESYDRWPQDQEAIDSIQIALKCCGMDNHITFSGPLYPPSCCGRGANKSSCSLNETYITGCSNALVNFTDNTGLTLGSASVGMAVILIFGIIVSFCMFICLGQIETTAEKQQKVTSKAIFKKT